MLYIQSNFEETLPHHFDAACALYGAQDLGLDYKLIPIQYLAERNLNNFFKVNNFVGSVEFMQEIWKILGKDPKVPMNSNRQHKTYTIDQVRTAVLCDKKLFVKPFQLKLFTGLVVDKYSINCLQNQPDNLAVMVYDVLPKIFSEWRCYIHHHKLVDIRNYAGDFFKVPEQRWIEEQLAKNKQHGFPCAYTMDVGVIYDLWRDSDSTVIEYNDMWAIGNYGMPNDLYVRMLRDRYFEIVK